MPPALAELYRALRGAAPLSSAPLSAHGSTRRYWRLAGPEGPPLLACANADLAENRAFLGFARHFRAAGLPVPQIAAVSADASCYLQEDLGDATLFDVLRRDRPADDGLSPEAARLYREAVELLPRFQICARPGLDFSLCHPRAAFDAQSMSWDCNYFKYSFLRVLGLPFPEQELEEDFATLIRHLCSAPSGYFLYRDYQSRNLMVRDGGLWGIDFQGGRRGALAYDVASLLLDAKAVLPFALREELLGAYREEADRRLAEGGAGPAEREQLQPAVFRGWYDAFCLIRLLQALGAYGFRGWIEKKTHFLQSVPYALRNAEHLLSGWSAPLQLPALFAILEKLTRLTRLREIAPVTVPLEVAVSSFSYKRGYPEDPSGHGGGHVFDCRCLPNPGREERFSRLSGRDAETVAWLESHPEVETFLAGVRGLVHASVDSYHRRNFTRLSVSFGCTGGRHRSVYCAERAARWLASLPHVSVRLAHRDLPASEGGTAPGGS